MFFPYNSECFMETEYPDLIGDAKAEIKEINIYLSINKEKIAVVERTIFPDARDKR